MDNLKQYKKYRFEYLKLKRESNISTIPLNQLGGVKYKLERITQQFIDSITGPPLYTLSPEQAREVLNRAAISDIVLSKDVIQKDINLTGFSIRITRPAIQNKLPVLLYIHGGGWVMGNKNTHDRLIREIVNRVNIAIVFVDYTLAPGGKFPLQLEQINETLSYIVQNKNDLSFSDDLIIMGDSVGSNMAISTVSTITNVKVNGLILAYPVISPQMNTNSYKEYENGPWLSKKAMEWFYKNYLPENTNLDDPLISSLNVSVDNFPSTLIITDENDVLRDEGELFAHKLMDNNIKVSAVRILGTCHDFLILDKIKSTPAVVEGIDIIIHNIKKFLNV